jgi:hypothetical protein
MSEVGCRHEGAVKPVVTRVLADGSEEPVKVVCQGCQRSLDADEVPFDRYDEAEDGWYRPQMPKNAPRPPPK